MQGHKPISVLCYCVTLFGQAVLFERCSQTGKHCFGEDSLPAPQWTLDCATVRLSSGVQCCLSPASKQDAVSENTP